MADEIPYEINESILFRKKLRGLFLFFSLLLSAAEVTYQLQAPHFDHTYADFPNIVQKIK